jgi:hypothetical protein
VSERIQADIWYKLWGNMTMNPISALTGATCDRILDDPLLNRYTLAIMAEAAAIGAKIGCPISQSGEDRNAVTRKLGAFKTSMLQDVEAGRPLEIDALLTAVTEIGERRRRAHPQYRRAPRPRSRLLGGSPWLSRGRLSAPITWEACSAPPPSRRCVSRRKRARRARPSLPPPRTRRYARG